MENSSTVAVLERDPGPPPPVGRAGISNLPESGTLLDRLSLACGGSVPEALPPQTVHAALPRLGLGDDAGRRPPCLAAGTRVLAARGWVAVEKLQAGDMLVTAHGLQQRLDWIGWRDVNCRRQADPARVQPIRVCAGAFAPDLPRHDVLLSPDQALFVEDALIPARLLANGATLLRESPAAIRYYHLGLTDHDVVLAEGLPVETDPRPDPAIDPAGRVCGAAMLAPARIGLHDPGSLIRRSRVHLLARADLLGFRVTQDADLHLLADGVRVWGSWTDGLWRGWVPDGVRELRIMSRAAAPADCHPDSDDQRRLGVAVGRIVLRGPAGMCSLEPQVANWGEGFHPVEDDGAQSWCWTDGAATLNPQAWAGLGSPFRLELQVVRTLTYRLEEPANLAIACADGWLSRN